MVSRVARADLEKAERVTEAELQRLAEIMGEISLKNDSINYWRAIGGFVAGIVAGILIGLIFNLALDWIRNQRAKKQKLREARISLYRALWDYKRLLSDVPDFGSTLHGPDVWSANQQRFDEIWRRILLAINSGEDEEYGRIIFEKLRFTIYQRTTTAGQAAEIKAVDGIIKSLEPDALFLTDRIHDDLLANLRKGPDR